MGDLQALQAKIGEHMRSGCCAITTLHQDWLHCTFTHPPLPFSVLDILHIRLSWPTGNALSLGSSPYWRHQPILQMALKSVDDDGSLWKGHQRAPQTSKAGIWHAEPLVRPHQSPTTSRYR